MKTPAVAFQLNFAPAIGDFDAFKHGMTRGARLVISLALIKDSKTRARKHHIASSDCGRAHVFTFIFPNFPLLHSYINLIPPCGGLWKTEKYTHYDKGNRLSNQ